MLAAITTLSVLALLAVAIRWLFGRSRARITLDPTCAACGYIVSRLPTTTCPECGADLARRGAIRAPQTVAPLSPNWLFFLWTATFWLGYAIINGVWLSRLPTVWITEEEHRWEQPRSKAYSQVSVDVKGELYLDSPLNGTARLSLKLLDGRKAKPHLICDIATNRCRQVTDQTLPGPNLSLDADAIVGWMRDCGVDVSGPSVRDEVDEIVRGIADTTHGMFRGSREFAAGGGGGGMRERSTRLVQAIRTSFVLAWLTGLALLWRKRNRAWRVAIPQEGPVQDVTTFDHLFEPTSDLHADDPSQT